MHCIYKHNQERGRRQERNREVVALEDLGIGWSCIQCLQRFSYKASIGYWIHAYFSKFCHVHYPTVLSQMLWGVSNCIHEQPMFNPILKWVTCILKCTRLFRYVYTELQRYLFVHVWCWHVSVRRHWDSIIHAYMYLCIIHALPLLTMVANIL